MQQRISYFDMLRGIAIVMVVLIHCFGRCYSFQNISLVDVAERNILNVAVPIFLAISGYFLSAKNFGKAGYICFLKKQTQRVYIPMLFCSLPLFAMSLKNGGSLIKSLVSLFSCSYSVYYFVAVIIQCYLLLPLIKSKTRLCSIVLGCCGVMWLLLYMYFFVLHLNRSLPLIVYAGHVFMWGFFFCLGVYVRKNGFFYTRMKYLFLLFLLSLFASVFESNYIMSQTQSLNGIGQKASAFLLNAIILVFLFDNKSIQFSAKFENNFIYKIFVSLGRYSFGIYLIHCFVLGRVINLVNWIHISSIKWIFCAIIVLFCSFLILFVCRKISPKLTHLLLGV